MSEPTYRDIVDALEDALFIHDPATGATLDVNRRACELFDYDRASMLATSIDDLSDPPYGAAIAHEHMRRAAQGEIGEPVEWRCRRRDGSTFVAEVTLRRAVIGEHARVVAVVRDVTARRTADEALRRSEAALLENRALLEKAQEVGRMGSWVSGLGDDRTLVWSRETYRIFGLEPSEPVDVDRFLGLVHPDDREAVVEAVARAGRERRPYAVEHRIVRPDGAVRWVLERADVAPDASGAPRLIGVCQDVTERRETDAHLRHAAKMDAVGRLAGGVAHDFNNMLTAIMGYTDLALMSLSPADPLAAQLGEIKQAAGRAASLTRQLLTFSRRAVVQPRVMDLDATLRELEPMLRRLLGEDIDLVLVTEPGARRVRIGQDELEQVIMNLVVNARDAMPQGGTLTLATGAVTIGESDPSAGPATVRPGAYALLRVSDTGHGMDDAVQARLFEPFFTTKERGKGTGLGLSTVYGIVQQTSGQITVRSAPGAGATFRVYLPLVDLPLDERSPAPARRLPCGHGRVLLVEDDAHVRALTAKLLTLHGYEALVAAGPDEARALSDAHPEAIDLLLTDVIMPRGSGLELYEQLRARRAGLRVVFMSGYADSAVLQRGLVPGAHRLIHKPFTPELLLREVGAALERQTPVG